MKTKYIDLDFQESVFLKRGMFIMIGLFLLANITAVGINTLLNQFLISPEFQDTVMKVQSDPIILLTSNVLPFPFVIYVLFLYSSEIFRNLRMQILEKKSLTRFVNIPVVFSSLAALGWIIGTISFQSQIFIWGYSDDWHLILESTLLTLSSAVASFVIGFYLLDYYQRKYLIPKIFKGSEYNEIEMGLRPSLKERFTIYVIATSILPGFITFRLLQIFNNNGENVYGKSLVFELILMYIILGLVITFITLLITNSIKAPLDKMREQAEQIQKGDFSKIILVETRDEIGNLSATMNAMTESLAEKEFIKDTFGRMVDPSVRDHLLEGNVQLGGEESEAVVLFSDLAGFTSLSENLEAKEVVKILNRYFSLMAECIAKEGGVINKFIGDAILAVYGMPIPLESPAKSALRSAISMQKAGNLLNEDLKKEGLPPLHTRIGIHKGNVIAGNIGSDSRMEYTVIGDTVNTASRLESACKKLNVPILFSETVFHSIEETLGIRFMGNLMLKGKAKPIKAYTFDSPLRDGIPMSP